MNEEEKNVLIKADELDKNHRMMRWLNYVYYGIFTLNVLFFVALFFVVIFIQDKVLYMPERGFQFRISAEMKESFPRHQELWFDISDRGENDNDDVKSRAELFLATMESDPEHLKNNTPTIILYTPQCGNVMSSSWTARQYRNTMACNVLLTEYPGYGESGGKPSQSSIRRMNEKIVGYLTGDDAKRLGVNPHLLVLSGMSLGCAVALDFAHTYKDRSDLAVKALVLRVPFRSYADCLRAFVPATAFHSLIPGVVREQWRNYQKIIELPSQTPIMILSSGMDEIAPRWQQFSLFKTALAAGQCRLSDADQEYLAYHTHGGFLSPQVNVIKSSNCPLRRLAYFPLRTHNESEDSDYLDVIEPFIREAVVANRAAAD